jgi:hypothetical protein
MKWSLISRTIHVAKTTEHEPWLASSPGDYGEGSEQQRNPVE